MRCYCRDGWICEGAQTTVHGITTAARHPVICAAIPTAFLLESNAPNPPRA